MRFPLDLLELEVFEDLHSHDDTDRDHVTKQDHIEQKLL